MLGEKESVLRRY